MTQTHSMRQYDQELDRLGGEIVAMGDLALHQLERAMQVLQGLDQDGGFLDLLLKGGCHEDGKNGSGEDRRILPGGKGRFGHARQDRGRPGPPYFFFTAEYSVRLKSTYSGERSEV